MWIVAALFLVTAITEIASGAIGTFVCGLLIAAGLGVGGYFNFKKLKQTREQAADLEQEKERETKRRADAAAEYYRTHGRMCFNIAGVTYTNDDGSERQAILKTIRKMDKVGENVEMSFREYQYNGRPSVYVLFNDKIAGNVPKENTEEMLKAIGNITESDYKISTFKNERDTTTFYCEISLTYKKV